MKYLKQLALSACVCLLASAAARASTIDFSTLSSSSTSNSTPFTTYTEFGYTVTATAGGWNVNNSTFGDPIPSIFTTANAGGGVAVTRTGGGQFTFSGVDLGEYQDSGLAYSITGSLSGSQVFSLTGALTSAFALYGTAYSAAALDRLTIQFSGIDGNVDNINVTNYVPVSTTPEPGSLLLVLTGAAGMTGLLRRRFTTGLRG